MPKIIKLYLSPEKSYLHYREVVATYDDGTVQTFSWTKSNFVLEQLKLKLQTGQSITENDLEELKSESYSDGYWDAEADD